MMQIPPPFDDRDEAIRAQRQELLDAQPGPRVGDYVEFADGIVRRISHLWPDRAQTSDVGSFYLGEGWVQFSGGLFEPVPLDSLVDTGEEREGEVWFFHHDQQKAHNGVATTVVFRVFSCDLAAPTV